MPNYLIEEMRIISDQSSKSEKCPPLATLSEECWNQIKENILKRETENPIQELLDDKGNPTGVLARVYDHTNGALKLCSRPINQTLRYQIRNVPNSRTITKD